MIAFGLGLLVASILMNFFGGSALDVDIETEARKKGMIYPDEARVIDKE